MQLNNNVTRYPQNQHNLGEEPCVSLKLRTTIKMHMEYVKEKQQRKESLNFLLNPR
jgi:hypothetical protein